MISTVNGFMSCVEEAGIRSIAFNDYGISLMACGRRKIHLND